MDTYDIPKEYRLRDTYLTGGVLLLGGSIVSAVPTPFASLGLFDNIAGSLPTVQPVLVVVSGDNAGLLLPLLLIERIDG